MDREELEDLLARLDAKLVEVKNATWELTQATSKAARVAESLTAAAGKMEAVSRRSLRRN